MRVRRPLLIPAAFAALVMLALAGCAERERANPFDPANQTTQGRPAGFMALARDGRVDLVWQPQSANGFQGYQVWRRTAYETTFHAISGILKPAVTHYADNGLLNGLDHAYRLYYVFDSGLGAGPAEDIATPGPQVPWVADGADGALLEVTADGRHVAASHNGFVRPVSVAVDTTTNHVWSSDPDAAEVRVYDVTNGVTLTIPVSGTPGAIATVAGDSSAWVCAEDGGLVLHLGPEGQRLGTWSGLQLPLGVAVSGFDGSLWVCEHDGNRVWRRDLDLGTLTSVTLPQPSRVAVDAATGEAWVTSFTSGLVWKLSPAGAPIDTLAGFVGPVGIAVDPVRGNVWVADPAGNVVRVFYPNGIPRFSVAGLPGARSVAIDPATGDGWVAAISSGEIIRISATGTVIVRLGGVGTPNDIAVMR
jgi:DNA-binding beta-propeller fold protein YncE